jgi:hypothetical protein
LNEKSDSVVSTNKSYDPVKKLISTCFKDNVSGQFKQCGVALRESGSLDFFWNYRIVDSFVVKDELFDGYVEDIDSDFEFIYYKKVSYIWGQDKIKEFEKLINQKATSQQIEIRSTSAIDEVKNNEKSELF